MEEKLQIDVIFEAEGVTAQNMCLTQMGPNLYRIEETPILIESVSYQDVIEANQQPNGSLMFRQIVKKADLRTYEYLLSKEIADSDELEIILDKVTAVGGHWERIFGGCLIIYVPLNTDYDPTNEMDRVLGDFGKYPKFMPPLTYTDS